MFTMVIEQLSTDVRPNALVLMLNPTVHLTSLRKTFFAWCFILNENILF